MKRCRHTILACLLLAMAAVVLAADTDRKTVANKKSEKGATYHRVPPKKLELACDECHVRGALPPELLRLRADDVLPKGNWGQVNPKACCDCHMPHANAPRAW